MARDPLGVLLAVRLREVERVRVALASCVAAEAAVAEQIRLLDAGMQADREASDGWQDGHAFHEMSAARLTALRVTRQRLAADLAAAEAVSATARGVVSQARAAAEAVEQLISERRVASEAEAAKREQHILDDIARLRLAARNGA